MIAGMDPIAIDGTVVFCTTDDDACIAAALSSARAVVQEAEGTTLVLPIAVAETHGFDIAVPMQQITLQVHSALDGVGLTAAVAAALAGQQIPCNVIAGFHHDHLFVPATQTEAALAALRKLAAEWG